MEDCVWCPTFDFLSQSAGDDEATDGIGLFVPFSIEFVIFFGRASPYEPISVGPPPPPPTPTSTTTNDEASGRCGIPSAGASALDFAAVNGIRLRGPAISTRWIRLSLDVRAEVSVPQPPLNETIRHPCRTRFRMFSSQNGSFGAERLTADTLKSAIDSQSE